MTPLQFAILRQRLVTRLVTALLRLWWSLGDWREGDQFARQAAPLVAGAQRALAGLVASYVADTASRSTGRVVAPPPIPDIDVVNLRGVDPVEVYRRPFVQLYTDLSRGKEFPDALRSGSVRLREIADLDLQQTEARAIRRAMTGARPRQARPSGWQRVTRDDKACAMCIIASTQRYNIEDLKALHPACRCTVRPLFGRQSHVIDAPRLEAVHAAIEQLTGRDSDRGGREVDVSKIMVQMVNEHGEVGPMLARPLDRFTSVEDIPRRTWG